MSGGEDINLGRRIARARAERGITQVHLAADLGVTERTLQAWERNERYPRRGALIHLANHLAKPVAWFYESDDDDDPEAVAA